MKKIIYILILILCSQSVIAQWPGPYTPMTGKGYQFKFIKIDSGLYVMKPALFEDTVLLKGYSYLNSTPGIGDSTLRLANTRFVMRAVALGGGSGGSGTVTSFSAGVLSPLFSTSVATATTTPALTFSAGNTTQFTVLGRKAAGTGVYSFIPADSALIPGLHSEAYYNTKYAAIGGQTLQQAITAGATLTGDNDVLLNSTALNFDGPGYFYVGKNTPATGIQLEATGVDLVSTTTGIIASDDVNITADTIDIIGKVQITDGSQGNGKVLTSDANGVASWATPAAGGITTLNTLTGATQTFATGTSGTNFAISSSGTTHTFNLPDAGPSNRGAITTGTQTIAGDKTFSGATTVGSLSVNANATIDGSGNITGANLSGGYYTPTYTNGANIQALTTYDLYFKRTSDGVEIWGKVEIDPTLSATSTVLTFTVPVASNFGDDTQAGGTGWARDAVGGFAVFSEPTLDELQIEFISVGTTNAVYSFTATYQIFP